MEPLYVIPLGAPLVLTAVLPQWIAYSSLAVVLLPWLLRRWRLGYFSVRTMLDLPWAVFCVAGLIGLAASVDYRLSLERFWGIFAGVALYYIIVNSRRGWYLHGYVICLSLAALLLGLWSIRQSSLDAFERTQLLWIVQRMHSTLPALSSIKTHPNEVASMVAPVIPLMGALSLLPYYGFAAKEARGQALVRRVPWFRLWCVACSLALLLILALTNSRGGFLAAFAGLTLCAVIADRRLLLLVPAAGAAGYSFVVRFISSPQQFLDTANGVGRLQLWESAYYMIQDFFFTGTGLGTFPYIYPFYDLSFSQSRITNVHNMHVQTYLDQGVFGFLSWLAILGMVGFLIGNAIRHNPRRTFAYVLSVGLAGYLLAMVLQGSFEASASAIFRDPAGAFHLVTSPLPYVLAGLALWASHPLVRTRAKATAEA